MFSNIFTFYGTLNVELDFLLIDDKDTCTEFEIKVTRKDFLDEFNKKIDKHTLLVRRDSTCPNRYIFICPQGVARRDEIPEYAGFVELIPQDDGTYEYKVVKKPPLLNSFKLDPKDLFYKLYYRYYNFENIRFNNDRKRVRKSDGTKAVKAKPIKTKTTRASKKKRPTRRSIQEIQSGK